MITRFNLDESHNIILFFHAQTDAETARKFYISLTKDGVILEDLRFRDGRIVFVTFEQDIFSLVVSKAKPTLDRIEILRVDEKDYSKFLSYAKKFVNAKIEELDPIHGGIA